MPQTHTRDTHSVGIVVIGRNEGDRLKHCINTLPTEVPVVYVDSGSTDGSLAFAREAGADVIELDICRGFTAARARNQGWRFLLRKYPNMDFVQFVDGDCEIREHWLEHAINAVRSEPYLASVFGRRRERFPDASIYNLLCDDEWNVPVGLVSSCGGDAFFRTKALKQVNGFFPSTGAPSTLSAR